MPSATYIFDFFLPRFCIHCNKKLNDKEDILCVQCFLSVHIADDERIRNEYKRKFANEKIVSGFQSNYVFSKEGPLQSVIHELKYNKKFRLGNFLGQQIAENNKVKILEWQADTIIPIPLHQLKKAERGFNQSDFIAAGISKALKLPIRKRSIRRSRYTQSQTNLSAAERKENIENAFTLKTKKGIINKNIILVDDVITTGATISECAHLLKSNGAANIFALSVAIAE